MKKKEGLIDLGEVVEGVRGKPSSKGSRKGNGHRLGVGLSAKEVATIAQRDPQILFLPSNSGNKETRLPPP